jgi:hypothetical protein
LRKPWEQAVRDKSGPSLTEEIMSSMTGSKGQLANERGTDFSEAVVSP